MRKSIGLSGILILVAAVGGSAAPADNTGWPLTERDRPGLELVMQLIVTCSDPEPTGGGAVPLMGTGEQRTMGLLRGSTAWNLVGPAPVASPVATDGRIHDLWTTPHGVIKAAPPPAATGSWTGFYAGGNLGLSVGKNPTDSLLFRQVIGGGSIRSPETLDLSPQGGLAGLQAGVNWQLGRHFVLGTEADYQWSNASGSACVLSCSDPNLRSGGLVYHQTLSSFGTLRGRAGWSSGPSLLYLTGGLAYGHFDTTIFHTQTAAFGRTAEGKSGWTAGGGLEWMFWPNWSAKFEYLYYDLGRVTNAFALIRVPPGIGVYAATQAADRFNGNIVRAGVNYHFNWGAAPILATY